MADWLTARGLGVELRPASPEDRELLRSIYRSTRDEELGLTPWSEAEKAAFVEMQFDAQDRYYRQVYPDGRFLVIVRDAVPIGRLYLTRLEEELRVVDIAILPEYRGTGVGSALLVDVIAEADASGLDVTLHVEPWNPARRLYLRLGFEPGVVDGVYERMRRPAGRRLGQLKTAS